MNKTSKAFLTELVDLCMENGVVITEQKDYAGKKVAGIRYHFESEEGVFLGVADVETALLKAKAELNTPEPMRIWRADKSKKRQWLVAISKEELLWSDQKESAKVFNFTPREYSRLLSRLEKADKAYEKIFGCDES